MRRKLWRNKWFILAMTATLFLAITQTRVAFAGTDAQLDKILKAGVDGLTEYFKFLIDVLQLIW
jgi:hypothetical protein